MGSFAAGAGTKYLAFTGESPSFTNATITGNLTLSGGTANGVLYLNGSKVVTSGSVLTFDGTTFTAPTLTTTGTANFANNVYLTTNATYYQSRTSGGAYVRMLGINAGNVAYVGAIDSGPVETIFNASSSSTNIQFFASGNEQMRLNSTGLGIGTTNPESKLHINTGGNTNAGGVTLANAGNQRHYWYLSSNTNSRFEIGSALGSFSWSNSNGVLQTLDASGNLGLGVTPSAWGGSTALQIGSWVSLASSNAFGTSIGFNNFYNGTNSIYSFNNNAARLDIGAGTFRFFTAPSGTAGNPISFTQAMTLHASGGLSVGSTADPGANTIALTKLSMKVDGPFFTGANIDSGNNQLGIGATGGTAVVGLFTVNTERIRIKSQGQLRFIPLAADPAGAENGDVYYNSATNKLRVYAGGAWVDLH